MKLLMEKLFKTFPETGSANFVSLVTLFLSDKKKIRVTNKAAQKSTKQKNSHRILIK